MSDLTDFLQRQSSALRRYSRARCRHHLVDLLLAVAAPEGHHGDGGHARRVRSSCSAALILARVFDLVVLNFLIRNSFIGLLIALPVVFQPEIRRALERVGRAGGRAFGVSAPVPARSMPSARPRSDMAKTHAGALIVMERETGLQDYTEKRNSGRRPPLGRAARGSVLPELTSARRRRYRPRQPRDRRRRHAAALREHHAR